MTEQDQYLLDELKTRLRLLIGKHKALKEKNKQLLNQQNRLENEFQSVKKENEELLKRNKIIKLAKIYTASDEEQKDAKQVITKIVREIDKCIAQLNV